MMEGKWQGRGGSGGREGDMVKWQGDVQRRFLQWERDKTGKDYGGGLL